MIVFSMLDDSSLECFRLTKLSTRWIKILLFLGFELLKFMYQADSALEEI